MNFMTSHNHSIIPVSIHLQLISDHVASESSTGGNIGEDFFCLAHHYQLRFNMASRIIYQIIKGTEFWIRVF